MELAESGWLLAVCEVGSGQESCRLTNLSLINWGASWELAFRLADWDADWR